MLRSYEPSQVVTTVGAEPRNPPRMVMSDSCHPKYNVCSKYEFIKTLGKGTYGKVKLAVQKDTGKKFAVKTIRKDRIREKENMEHIRREMKIMSSLCHPNIIQIHEVFENQDKIVIVMEYAPEGELYDYLADKRLTSEEESRVFFRQIVSAVQYCHKRGVVHRDLKLENILLGENHQIKIADFGLANLFRSDKHLRTFCGSPLYASPEIVNGIPYIGPEVDSWSLGVLLYTLIYGMMPFDGSDYKKLTWQISHGEYSKQTKHSDAADLIQKMLTVDPIVRADVNEIANHYWLRESPSRTTQHNTDANSNHIDHSPKDVHPSMMSQNSGLWQPSNGSHTQTSKPPIEPLTRTVLTPCALENCENSNCPLTQRKGILKRFGAPLQDGASIQQQPVASVQSTWPTPFVSPAQRNCLNGLHAKDSLKLKAKPLGASGKRRVLRSKKDRESGYYSSPERTPVEIPLAAPMFTFTPPVIKPHLGANVPPEKLKPRYAQTHPEPPIPNQFCNVPFGLVMPMSNLSQSVPILEGQAMSFYTPVTVQNAIEHGPGNMIPYTVTALNSDELRGRPISTYSDSSILSSDSFELCTFESPLSSGMILTTAGHTTADNVIHVAQTAPHVVMSPAIRPASLPLSFPGDGRSSPLPSGALTPTSKLKHDLEEILGSDKHRRRKRNEGLRDSHPTKLAEEQANQLEEMMRQLNLDLERACKEGLDMKMSRTASAEV